MRWPLTLEERFWAKVNKNGPNGCWVWTAYKNRAGYGEFGYRKRKVKAHRFIYEFLLGPIPKSLQLDHLCRNRACINPTHLEVVSPRINLLRGNGLPAQAAKR